MGNPSGVDGQHFYDSEAEARGDVPWKSPNSFPRAKSYWYSQAHQPILQQQTIEGHAVRAMYLLTAVTDTLCLEQLGIHTFAPERAQWFDTVTRLWNNMVDRKMYITGGIGAVKQWESFGIDYFLPQGTDEGGCYSETCAAIGVMMAAERLLHVGLDSRYADIMESCLYNSVMTSMSLDGKEFTYVNQLASSGQDKSAREEWFDCACCPPNLTRLFGSWAAIYGTMLQPVALPPMFTSIFMPPLNWRLLWGRTRLR
ncbi:glycoside hydrolase family 127 protein [Cadophora sp. DSE1049]|nr:glycoside hydrolase family 127 protein [Cadophora sp. DSE1049]